MDNTSKWFLEVVQDRDGSYYANLIVGGKLVEGIPKNVSYRELQDAIREQTGIEILKKKDMRFESTRFRDGKKFAYIDNTEERKDCRVSLRELNGLWYPEFEPPVTGDKVFIYPHANHALNLNDACILEGTVVDRTPAVPIESSPRAANVCIHLENRIHRDGSVDSIDRINNYYDSDTLYVHSLEDAKGKAKAVYEKIDVIKSLPRMENPEGPFVSDYFRVINIKALSDDQLLILRDLAKDFGMSMSFSRIKNEMVQRFEKNTRKSLDELIHGAETKSHDQKRFERAEMKAEQER